MSTQVGVDCLARITIDVLARPSLIHSPSPTTQVVYHALLGYRILLRFHCASTSLFIIQESKQISVELALVLGFAIKPTK